MEEKSVKKFTKKDFDSIPQYENATDKSMTFDSLVIIPKRKKHDSGWRCMEFVAIKKGKPIYRFGGMSDALNIDGIGGGGEWRYGKINKTVLCKGWEIDILDCGYIHLFCKAKYMLNRPKYTNSDAEIFAIERNNNEV